MKKEMASLCIAMLLTLSGARAATAATTGAAQGGAGEVVAHAIETVVKAAQSDPGAASGDANATSRVVEREFLPYTDFRRTTRLAVGAAWKTATAAQQQQLFEQFQLLLVHVYALQLTQIRGQKLSFKFSPAVVSPKGDDATVATEVNGTGDSLQVGYRLERTPTGWKIYDIDMMGAWLILVYRQQFAAQIAQGGVDGLIKFLSAHNARFGK